MAIASSIPSAAASAAQAVAVCTRRLGDASLLDQLLALRAPALVLGESLLDREHVAVLDDQIVAAQPER